MLDLAKIQAIAQTYSPQELFAALVWQRRFNEFNGEEVITDLSHHSQLWKSFLFTKPVYADDGELSYAELVTTLLAMANYLPMPQSSMIQFVPYPADTLYVLTQNQDTIVSQLLDLGKKWRADSVEVTDDANEVYGWRLRRGLRSLAKQSPHRWEHRDAAIVAYWWD